MSPNVETKMQKAVEHIERKMGGVDVLVNNAGITEPGRIEALSAEQVDRVVAVNLGGVVHGCRAVIPAMRRRRAGRIVNVGSLGGIMPVPCEAIYCATKYAVRGFTFALREELSGSGVDVSVVSCDSVATPMLEQSAQHDGAWMSFVNRPLDSEIVA
jgi:short-subunit dehydrogenase